MDAKDRSIGSQVAAKVAGELVVAGIANGFFTDFDQVTANVGVLVDEVSKAIFQACAVDAVATAFPGATTVPPTPPVPQAATPSNVVPLQPPAAPPPPPAAAPPPPPAGAGPVYLNVPIQQKDAAKGMGARWDPNVKKWYVPAGTDPSAFAIWFN